jgi:hypothetical protein
MATQPTAVALAVSLWLSCVLAGAEHGRPGALDLAAATAGAAAATIALVCLAALGRARALRRLAPTGLRAFHAVAVAVAVAMGWRFAAELPGAVGFAAAAACGVFACGSLLALERVLTVAYALAGAHDR